MFPIETIYGQIIGKANNYQIDPRHYARIIKSDKVRAYEREFIRQCTIYKGKQINCPFELVVAVYYRHHNFDLDNSLKTLLDCLQYVGAITNDNLCTRIIADKMLDPATPRVEFSIIADPEPPTLFSGA